MHGTTCPGLDDSGSREAATQPMSPSQPRLAKILWRALKSGRMKSRKVGHSSARMNKIKGCWLCRQLVLYRQGQHDSFGVRNQLADLEAEKIVHTRHQLAAASDNGDVAGT